MSRLAELNRADTARRVHRLQGAVVSPLTFSSSRVIAGQVGTFHNLPITPEDLPVAQNGSGDFYETPGWSESGGGDVTRLRVDTLALTADSGYSTADRG